MKKPWLILDCNYLCHRAYHSTGSLSYHDVSTGVSFGFFKEVYKLITKFNSEKLIFCFDSGISNRKKISSVYKSNRRKNLTDDELENLKELNKQIIKLEKKYLPFLGFKNIFSLEGFEADDLIASICKYSLNEEKAIIVSADADLYQLLSNKVKIYNPYKQVIITPDSFYVNNNISFNKWYLVKAIAGCSSDCVVGVNRVGEKTAIKFLNKELKKESKAYKSIKESIKLIQKNIPLVKLPLKGTPKITIKKPILTSGKRWKILFEKLGMKSLISEFPRIIGRE
jgi:DNA polymerase-1